MSEEHWLKEPDKYFICKCGLKRLVDETTNDGSCPVCEDRTNKERLAKTPEHIKHNERQIKYQKKYEKQL